jgi:hypothetical protein
MDDRVIRKVEQDKATKRLVEAEIEYRAGVIDTNYRVSRGMLIAGCKWREN